MQVKDKMFFKFATFFQVKQTFTLDVLSETWIWKATLQGYWYVLPLTTDILGFIRNGRGLSPVDINQLPDCKQYWNDAPKSQNLDIWLKKQTDLHQ